MSEAMIAQMEAMAGASVAPGVSWAAFSGMLYRAAEHIRRQDIITDNLMETQAMIVRRLREVEAEREDYAHRITAARQALSAD